MLNFITMILAVNRSDALIGFLDHLLTSRGKEKLFKVCLSIMVHDLVTFIDFLHYFWCCLGTLHDPRFSNI